TVETLAFIRDGDIWLIGADGSNERRLNLTDVQSFTWISPDELDVVTEGEPPSHLLVDLEGNVRELLFPGDFQVAGGLSSAQARGSWSRDGSLFVVPVGEQLVIYDKNGDRVRQLDVEPPPVPDDPTTFCDEPGSKQETAANVFGSPIFTPDKKSILVAIFCASRNPEGELGFPRNTYSRLYRVSLDSGAVEPLQLSTNLRSDSRPSFSPDNSRIALPASSYTNICSISFGLSVANVDGSDDAVLEMIEKRRQAPRLTVMVLLEPEVRELADAHVYLDESDPNAPQALDLLLGTQGWRRFAFHEAQAFVREHGDAARRVLALRVAQQWRRAGHGGWAGIEKGLGRVVDAAAPAPDEPVNKPNQIKFGVEVRKPRDEAGQKDAARRDRELDRRLGPDRDKQEAFAALRQRGGFANQRQIGRGMFAQDEISVLADLVAVRVYAHSARPARQPGDRIDFAETLFWNTGVRTDAKTGQVKVRFDLSDSVTAFRVFADGFDAAGRLGQATTAIESVEPFYIEPKLPLEVTAGDLVLLPVGIVSHLDGGSHQATLTVETDSAINVGLIEPFLLSTTERQRRLIPLKIGSFNGATKLVVRADVQQIHDQVTRPLIVKPLGFPVEVAFGGLTVPDGSVTHKINIPADVVPGSITTDIAVYPTPLANLTQALERLIREPSGCFEQTCSTSYPLTMAQQYFLTHAGVDPDLIERSRRSLDKGYARLISFECKQRGYEWFGGDPGHEALTAFGLLHFADMAKVRTVDSAMLERTRRWLLNTRDGQGGFARKRRALHSWIEDQDCSNAYILWALLESGEKDLAPEIASLKNAATKSPNSYVLALAANAMALAGDTDAAIRLMQRLAKKQTQDGWVAGATSSIVGSGGSALKIETTALAVLAWLRDPAFAGPVENGVRFLADSCKAGRYGSTQSTVLALRAIIAYDKLRSRPKTAGSVTIYVDGQSVGGPVQFDEHTQGAIKLPDISELLTPGQHALEVRMHGGSAMPLSLAVNYYDRLPPSSEECKLDLSVSLRETKVTEGELTEADVIVRNRSDEPIPTPIAIIGLPGGLEPRHDQLKELVKAGRVDAYEVRGREIVLYWRSMKPGQEARISLSLIAAIPGTYTAPASRAYLYYTDEFKRWADPLKVSIPPRGGK
ncbi:MAG: hypothetical protein IH986_18735, partial [Planctomycetes bacterium]|nr:hypothetical protein [Planctomycetota bacterium]